MRYPGASRHFVMTSTHKELIVAILTTLYLQQGVLYGFQIQVLPVLLRINGASHILVGSIHLVAFPWLLKSLWAPFIDSCSKNSLWLAVSLWSTSVCLFGAQTENRALFLAAMLLLNVCSATTDLALGQILLSTFTASEIPRVSSLHIIGYKCGALIGGGMILWITAYLEKTNAILPVLSAIYFTLGIGVVWTSFSVTNASHAFDSKVRHFNVTQFSTRVRSLFNTPGTWWVAGFVCGFKLTSHSAKTLFVMFLVDRGFTLSYIGFMSGMMGQLVSIAVASGVGFLLSAKRVCATTVLIGTALLLVSCILLQLYTACWDVRQSKILLALALQHVTLGAQATPLNTLMLQCSQNAPRSLRATHYSLLCTLETLSRQVAMFLAGVLAEFYGYCFALTVSLTISLTLLVLVYHCPNDWKSDRQTCARSHEKTSSKQN